MTVAWPAGTVARGSNDMVALIRKEPGSIGYVAYGHAEKSDLSMAQLQNKAGEYIRPTLANGQAALNSSPLPASLRVRLPDPEGKDSYPIVTYTWLLLHRQHSNPRVAGVLKELVKYGLTEGQKDCAGLGYIPLPEKARSAVLEAVDGLSP
jgi:phosphate transport system substrate-binding protein